MSQVNQHWSIPTILLSYIISVTGSYCTIQLMEQWRIQQTRKSKLFLLNLSSIALGGCGIWCTHFTGMNAVTMKTEDGMSLTMNFDGWLTLCSLILPIIGVFLGLKISSTDPFFYELEQSRRKQILKNLNTMATPSADKYKVNKKIKMIALFSRLQFIGCGGLLAALGVLGMHYLGMLAQRTNAHLSLNTPFVAISCVIAFVTANVAFWILFRALTFWPHFEWLRMASALIMGIAICGTHYSGMAAGSYTYTEEDQSIHSNFIFNGQIASTTASHTSLFLCFWMTTFAIVVPLRRDALSSRKGNEPVQGPTSETTYGKCRSDIPADSRGWNPTSSVKLSGPGDW